MQELEGEAWLVERRLKAAAVFEGSKLPTESEEDWRYSRIGELKLDQFALAPAASSTPTSVNPQAADFIAAVGTRAGLIRTLNGSVVSIDLADSLTSAGITVERLTELSAAPAVIDDVRSHLDSAFIHLSDAYAKDAVVITVPSSAVASDPIVVIHEISAAGDPVVVFPQTFISLGQSATASVIEFFCSDEQLSLVVPTTAMDVGANATLNYQSVQQLGSKAWQLGSQLSRLGRDATFKSFATSIGGEYARMSIDTQLAGEGSESQLLAVYFGDDNQIQDFRTYQEHAAKHSKSELVFKGAVAGHSRSVYTGMIQIDRGAVKSDASQTNRNLVLSEGAHADSVPNLNIEENDVRCTHASAVGPIDTEQLFYLETRGVPTETAKQLILLGFFNDLFDRAPSKAITQYLKGVLASRLLTSDVTVDSETVVA